MKSTNKKIESVKISNYQALAMRTCLKSAKNRIYARFNLCAELAELVAKVEGYRAKQIRDRRDFDAEKSRMEIRDEIGDCFWQLALLCELQKNNFEKLFKDSKLNMASGITIDSYIDFDCDISHFKNLDLLGLFSYLKGICKVYRLKPSDCLRANIRKLASRQQRGKIKGNGDNR